jgi:hypothetical protein
LTYVAGLFAERRRGSAKPSICFVCALNRLWQAMAEGPEAGDAFTVTRLQQELQDLQGGVL